MTSFSDVALQVPEGAPKLHDTFESKYVTQYLEEYVDSHVYNGSSLRSRIRLNTEVRILASSTYKNVTVLGGGKSASDMVYASVKAGKNVNWIIRKTGEGPGIFMNPAATGRYRNNAEAGTTQRATTLNPSGFRPMEDWAQTLHQSASERENLESKLFAADRRFKVWANNRGREGALPGFRELEPKAS